MSKKKLFDEDSDEDIAIKTENEYAKKYDSWREKEEIHKLEQKYGPNALNTDGDESSDSEDESDEAPEVNEEVEEQFLKTLALLKTKDPRIYDPSFKCFEQEEQKKTEEKSVAKTLTFDDSDDEDEGGDIFKIEKKAEVNDDDVSTATPKKVKKDKKIKEYLTGKAEHIDDEVEKDLAPLKALWSDPKLNEGEAFLRDYILNKRYLEDGDVGEGAEKLRDDADLEADEQTVEEQSKFERAYNFRFEEPDDEYLKRFPRTMNSIRPKDDRRSRKRAEVRERKEEDKRRKMEEIGRLKALKLKEIQEKIAKIKEVTGNQELAFKEEDIEGDFDPEEHDRRMKAMFDEEYYGGADSEKPVFPDLDEELEIENWDKYDIEAEQTGQPRDEVEPHCEDEDFNMDAEYDPKQARAGLLQQVRQTLGRRRGRKRRPRLAALLAADKPKYLPAPDHSYDQYMEEYYKMDCEDVVGGDLPTRFKYRQVVPNDYGLTVEEILLADDRELTQWVPLKKIVRHRPENVEKGEVKTYAQKAADIRLKKKMLPSLFRDLPEEPELVVPVEQGSKKKKNKQKHEEDDDKKEENNEQIEQNEAKVTTEVKRKKKKQATSETSNDLNKTKLITAEDSANCLAEVKSKKKKKHKPRDDNFKEEDHNSSTVTSNENADTEINNKLLTEDSANCLAEVKSKKKKKHKPRDDNFKEEDHNSSTVTSHENAATEVKINKKKKKRTQNEISGDVNFYIKINVSNSHKDENVENLVKTKKHRPNCSSFVAGFVVEDVYNQAPSQESKIINVKSKANKNETIPAKALKRKLETHADSNKMHKKKKQDFSTSSRKNDFKAKFNQKDKLKNKDKFKKKQNNDSANDNPLSTLSDERLKAYGLNPKKYKNFLKYKKF